VWEKKTGFGYALHMSSWFLPGLKPCDHNNICTETRKIHEVVFFLGIYLISTELGGINLPYRALLLINLMIIMLKKESRKFPFSTGGAVVCAVDSF